MRAFTPLTSGRETPGETPIQTERGEDLDEGEETEKKPAILMSEGTLQRVAFKERPKPVIPTSTLKKIRRRVGKDPFYSSQQICWFSLVKLVQNVHVCYILKN